MDLSEMSGGARVRHPWEQSRVRAIKRMLGAGGISSVRTILDYGCGDAYTGRSLLDHFSAERLVGLDLHLSEEQAADFSAGDSRIELLTDSTPLAGRRFDLMLACDVIEHVEDDQSILRLVRHHLSECGVAVVTVPAFQALFTEHDRMLRHFRRYTLDGLRSSIRRAGLEVRSAGYLYGSLLLPRALGKLKESIFGPSDVAGLGGWNGGPLVTRLLTDGLSVENALWIELSRRGIRVPGLSAWALCH